MVKMSNDEAMMVKLTFEGYYFPPTEVLECLIPELQFLGGFKMSKPGLFFNCGLFSQLLQELLCYFLRVSIFSQFYITENFMKFPYTCGYPTSVPFTL